MGHGLAQQDRPTAAVMYRVELRGLAAALVSDALTCFSEALYH